MRYLNLAYRRFCRLDLDGAVPDHSTFSKNRRAASGRAIFSVACSRVSCPVASRRDWSAEADDHFWHFFALPNQGPLKSGRLHRRSAGLGESAQQQAALLFPFIVISSSSRAHEEFSLLDKASKP
jgi:hypothetical protein